MSETDANPIKRAATVVLLRDGEQGLETLLLRRNSKLAFGGGAWVFPGGALEPADFADQPDDLDAAAWRAAVRETREEAGMCLAQTDLHFFAHWTAPPEAPKRFATWFFIGEADAQEVAVDGGEIHDHQWFRPVDALAAQRTQQIELMPPTFVTLVELADCTDVAAALGYYSERGLRRYAPRFATVEDQVYLLYPGDAGYDAMNPQQAGPRHRLWMHAEGWRYLNSEDGRE